MRNEDTDWIGNLLHYINSVDYCENLFYVYRKGTGSAQTDTPPTFEIITDLSKIIKKTHFQFFRIISYSSRYSFQLFSISICGLDGTNLFS